MPANSLGNQSRRVRVAPCSRGQRAALCLTPTAEGAGGADVSGCLIKVVDAAG